MEKLEVIDRYNVLCRREWGFDEIREWFGVDLDTANQSLLAQFRIFAEGWNRWNYETISLKDKWIDRFAFETFLQYRHLVPVRFAAASVALDVDSFLRVLRKAESENYISKPESEGEFPGGVYRKELISDLHTRFPDLRSKTFSSYGNKIDRLHAAFRETFGIDDLTVLRAPDSRFFDDKAELYAHDFDCITGMPIALPHQVIIETGKPSNLRPDVCSAATYKRNEDFLEAHLLGSPPLIDEQTAREILESNG